MKKNKRFWREFALRESQTTYHENRTTFKHISSVILTECRDDHEFRNSVLFWTTRTLESTGDIIPASFPLFYGFLYILMPFFQNIRVYLVCIVHNCAFREQLAPMSRVSLLMVFANFHCATGLAVHRQPSACAGGIVRFCQVYDFFKYTKM